MDKGIDMKFQIFYGGRDNEDSFTIEGENLDDVREKANAELRKRNVDPDDAWSAEL